MKENRQITLRFRITESELQALKSKMEAKKYITLSDYIRAKTIGKTKRVKQSVK